MWRTSSANLKPASPRRQRSSPRRQRSSTGPRASWRNQAWWNGSQKKKSRKSDRASHAAHTHRVELPEVRPADAIPEGRRSLWRWHSGVRMLRAWPLSLRPQDRAHAGAAADPVSALARGLCYRIGLPFSAWSLAGSRSERPCSCPSAPVPNRRTSRPWTRRASRTSIDSSESSRNSSALSMRPLFDLSWRGARGLHVAQHLVHDRGGFGFRHARRRVLVEGSLDDRERFRIADRSPIVFGKPGLEERADAFIEEAFEPL